MDRFACGYCGVELLVERRGGTVALRAVERAIERVQIGTDKTAAELALSRLKGELAAKERDVNRIKNEIAGPGCTQAGCLGLTLIVVATLVGASLGESIYGHDSPGHTLMTFAFMALGALCGWLVWRGADARTKKRLRENRELLKAEDELARLKGLIEQNQQIANS
jgi:hypothetical protein